MNINTSDYRSSFTAVDKKLYSSRLDGRGLFKSERKRNRVRLSHLVPNVHVGYLSGVLGREQVLDYVAMRDA